MILWIVGITTILLILSVSYNVFLGLPLFLSVVMFAGYAYKKGYTIKQVGQMIFSGAGKALMVIRIFLLIGALTALWMSCGTIPFFINMGIELIHPSLFILSAFMLSCAMSYLIGTSFGTATTIGVVLMAIARSGDVNLYLTAGAVLCGAYFGDRGSPMASSLILASTVTETDNHQNVAMCLKTATVPLIISSILFYIFSLQNPMATVSSDITNSVAQTFNLNPIVVLPALLILILAAFKVDVQRSIIISSITAFILAITVQHSSLSNILKAVIFGFSLNESSPIAHLIKGGGLLGMFNAAVVVLLSCCIAGIAEGTKITDHIFHSEKNLSRHGLYLKTLIVSFATSAIGCNQTIAIVMTSEIMNKQYSAFGLDNNDLVRDITITASLTPTILPWSIAVLTPVTMLGLSGVGYMPYLFFPYIMVIYHYVVYLVKSKKEAVQTAEI
ncbi:MAG: Na+/H+ antiporter NhaC family protein [Oscillospiraceae bacterium]